MPPRKENPGVDIRKDYDHDDRLHELLRDVYTLTTGIDPVPNPEEHPSRFGTVAATLAEPEPQDQPPESTGEAPEEEAAVSKRKMPAKKPSKRVKLTEPVDDVVKDLGRDEDSDDNDDVPIAQTRSQRRAASSQAIASAATEAREGRTTRSTRSNTTSQRQVTQKGAQSGGQQATVGANEVEVDRNKRPVPEASRVPMNVAPVLSTSMMDVASRPTVLTPPDIGIPVRVSLAYNFPQNAVGRTLTTSLSNIDTMRKLVLVFLDSYRREVASLGGRSKLDVRRVWGSSGAGEGMRFVDVTTAVHYLEWVRQLTETARRSQRPDFVWGDIILVVRRGGEGTNSWGDAPGSGPSWGKKDVDEEGKDDTTPPSAKKLKMGQQQGSAKKSSTKQTPTVNVSGTSQARDLAPTGPPLSQESSFEHVWEALVSAQQPREERPRSFTFTKAEEETDDEEMVEVPRAYLERLELGSIRLEAIIDRANAGKSKTRKTRRDVVAEKVRAETEADREERAANKQFFEAQT